MGNKTKDLGHVPSTIDWSKRAVPYMAALDEYGTYAPKRAVEQRAREIARDNIAYLQHKFLLNGGTIIGYHGTASKSAEVIANSGFCNMLNVEGLAGVSAWDEVVGRRALDFAERHALELGESSGGQIIQVRMQGPQLDTKYGRLEWLGQAEHTEVTEIIPAAEFIQFLGMSLTQSGKLSA